MQSKLQSAKKLLKSKWYVLITDKETIIDLKTDGMAPVLIIHAVTVMKQQLDKLVAKVEKGISGGRKPRGRKTSSKNK